MDSISRVFITLLATAATGAVGAQTAVTVYSTAGPGAIEPSVLRAPDGNSVPGYALVREDRQWSLSKGRSEIREDRIPALLDPATVQVTAANGAMEILAQRFQNDLADMSRLLQRYVGQQVEVEQLREGERVVLRGELLSASHGLLLRQDDGGVQWLRDYSNVRLPGLPEGAAILPTLFWAVQSNQAVKQTVALQYETGGFAWWAEYRLAYDEGGDGCRAALNSWASVVNHSGKTFENARLTLVAGEVHRAKAASAAPRMRTAMLEAAPQQDFAERPVADYHQYSLERTVDLADGAMQQWALFPLVEGIPCRKELVYRGARVTPLAGLRSPITDPSYGTSADPGVQASVEFQNSAENGLGRALPAGRVRVHTTDGEGGAFVGEDRIDHTAENESVRLRLGRAFDIVGERTQVDFQVDNERRVLEEEITITLRNHKAHAVEVRIEEPMARWRQWQILENSHSYEKVDAGMVAFPVAVAAGDESVVRYRVRYSW